VQYQELVLGDEVLTALCVIVRLLNVLDVGGATTHCPGVCDWDCARVAQTLAIVHSRRLVVVLQSFALRCPAKRSGVSPSMR